jgi:pentapeptide MXKDX repeat protein
MKSLIRSLAFALVAAPLAFGIAHAQDAMKKPDAMKADSMGTHGGKAMMDSKAPDAMMADCMQKARMEKDAMKAAQMEKACGGKDAMKADAMKPDAMSPSKK